MPGDAPMEMDPEFVRLVGDLRACEMSRVDVRPAVAALHRWHREQVERAVREAEAALTHRLLDDAAWAESLRAENEPYGGPADA